VSVFNESSSAAMVSLLNLSKIVESANENRPASDIVREDKS
jgi:hypothetical protein